MPKLRNLPGESYSFILFVTCLIGALIFLLAGTAVFLTENLKSYDHEARQNLALKIYLREDTTPIELAILGGRIKAMPGYESFEYHDKAAAYAEMQRSLGNQLLPDNGFNPFPNSFSIQFFESFSLQSNFESIEDSLRSMRCVEEVNYRREWLIEHERVLGYFNSLGKITEVVSFLAAALYIFWGMRGIAIFRLPEIRAIRLLGGGFKHLHFPSLRDGAIIGVSASAIGAALLYLIWAQFLPHTLDLDFVSSSKIMLLLLTGFFTGLLSSLVSNFLPQK